MDSGSMLEILQDISSRLAHLEEKVDMVMERVEDLMDNYHPDNNVKYLNDLPSKSLKAEYEASWLELHKTRDIYSEVLHQVAKERLDRDMAIIKAKGLQVLTSDLPLGINDLYKILNRSFWIGTTGTAGLYEQMLAHNKFLWACWDFYNTHGYRVEWQLWKWVLKDQEGYQVEDSDEPLDLEEEIWEDMVPGTEAVSVLDLDALIKMPMPEVNPEEEVEKEL